MANTIFLLLVQTLFVLVWTEELHSNSTANNKTTNTGPFVFDADKYIEECQTPHKLALLKIDFVKYRSYINKFLWCIFDKYTGLIRPKLHSLPWDRNEKLNSTYLPKRCAIVENYLRSGLPDRGKKFLYDSHREICLLEAHLEELTFLRGHPVSNESKEEFLICTTLATEATDQIHVYKILDYSRRTTECFFRLINVTLEALQQLPRLRGLHALAPEQRLRGSRYWSPPHPKLSESPRELRTVRFVGGGGISCNPKWISRVDNELSYVFAIILKIIANHMDSYTCITVANSWNDDMLSLLMLGFVDVLLESQFLYPGSARFTYPFLKDDLCMVLLRNRPDERSISESFSMSTWLGVIITLLVFEVATSIQKGVFDVIETLQTFVTGAFNERQRPLGNFLSLILCLFGLITVNAFAGVFTSLLAAPSEVSQPQTLEEVDARVSKVYAPEGFDGFIQNIESGDVVHRFVAKWETKDRNPYPEDLNASDVTVIDSSANIKSWRWLSIFREENGRSKLYVVPECIVSPTYSAFLRAKTWPDASHFDFLFMRLVDSGVMNKHLRMYEFLKKVKGRDASPKDVIQPHALGVLREPTVLLGCGLALSIFSFLVEITFARCKRSDEFTYGSQRPDYNWTNYPNYRGRQILRGTKIFKPRNSFLAKLIKRFRKCRS